MDEADHSGARRGGQGIERRRARGLAPRRRGPPLQHRRSQPLGPSVDACAFREHILPIGTAVACALPPLPGCAWVRAGANRGIDRRPPHGLRRGDLSRLRVLRERHRVGRAEAEPQPHGHRHGSRRLRHGPAGERGHDHRRGDQQRRRSEGDRHRRRARGPAGAEHHCLCGGRPRADAAGLLDAALCWSTPQAIARGRASCPVCSRPSR